MTVALRDTILFIGIFIAIVMLCISLAFLVLFFLFPDSILSPLQNILKIHSSSFLLFLTKILLFSIIGVIASIFFRRQFRRSVLGESFFFTIFLVSLAFETLALLQVVVLGLDKSPYFGTIVTRAVVLGRLVGVFSLFASGLFAAGIQYKKFGVYAGVGFLLSLIFSASIAVDSSVLQANLLNRIGNMMELRIALWVIQAFAVLNFFWAGFSLNNRDYSLMGIGFIVLIVGKELLFAYSAPVILLIGFILLVLGIVFFGNRLQAVYLWF